jgi:hypothetical protein
MKLCRDRFNFFPPLKAREFKKLGSKSQEKDWQHRNTSRVAVNIRIHPFRLNAGMNLFQQQL